VPVTFEPNKAYLRELLGIEIDFTTIGAGYVQDMHEIQDMHERFERPQESTHGGEKPPSELVIEENRTKSRKEYRLETEGPHPVANLRANRADR
jgi:hypothetical protein